MKIAMKRFWTVLIILVFVSVNIAEIVGNVSYAGQPENLNTQTLELPHGIVALSEQVSVGIPSDFASGIDANPSVMFVLDNSASMWMLGDQYEKDVKGNRFKVALRLIDSLYARNPNTEIGISVFGTELYFNTNDDALFKATSPGDSGGYLPLLNLSKEYTSDGAGTKSGREIIRHYLSLDERFKNINPLVYKGVEGRLTNITAGFDGARSAFSHTKNSVNRQYVIFISDGDATAPGSVSDTTKETPALKAERERFMLGENIPTTFTIFFAHEDTPDSVPPSIVTMTNSIQRSSYSTNNDLSNFWPYTNTTEDDLVTFLMDKVISVIDKQTDVDVADVKINDESSVSDWSGSSVTFGDMIPLTGDTTQFTFDINYRIEDTVNSDGSIHIDMIDTVLTTNFSVRLSNDAQNPVADSLTPMYWERSLGFYSGYSKLSSVDSNCTIRFIEKARDLFYGYENVSVTVKSQIKGDSETFYLSTNGNEFTQTILFDNENTASVNDGVVQVEESDILIARFENPKLPLDTIEITIPYSVDPVEKVDPLHSIGTLYIDVLSPYIQGVSPIPTELEDPSFQLRTASEGGYTGMAMQARMILADEDSSYEDLHIAGTVQILDQIGNTVLKPVDLLFMPQYGTLIYVWDGLNELGREVSSGAYLAQFSVRVTVSSRGYEERIVKNVMVGVKKPRL